MQTLLQLENLSVIYQDEYMVAIHKPAGLLVHRSPIDKQETQFAVQLTEGIIGQKVFPIHRLDKATSGLLLFALDATTARNLSDQFMNHTIQKTYLAICRGWATESGHIEHALKYKRDKIAEKMKREQLEPQSAETAYKNLATTSVNHTIGRYEQQRYSLLELKPRTGRKHQLRRHMNHIVHPIIGDTKYGDRHHNHFFSEWLGQHRLYLAATQLQFLHPKTSEPILLECHLENSFQHALNKLKL
ncbi:pseudouridine synthase [Thiomicrorhabdus lithotrophica]|uniref:tRNA pseudouridine synthase C n=1 Tax=Thiomicrorhabdus lithotrophica TaxID=2949997 RepID=A0ABY8CAI6_9GAMM|nr:pseudouridine synthase [Thiomicrorhabdus lithotrophica]WEJ62991.1 pseudouridine synthase [Thiomicrorhabdus lithotrophica]